MEHNAGTDRVPVDSAAADSQALLSALPDLIFVLDNTDVFISAYSGDPSALVVPPERFLGRHVADVLPAMANDILCLCDLARGGGGVQTLEYEVTLSGIRRWYEARLSAFDGGKIAIVSREVTARRRVEADLRRAEAAIRRVATFRETILRTAAEGIVVYRVLPDEPYAEFILWNDRMTSLTGYDRDEINTIGWHHALFPDPDARAAAVARLRESERELLSEEWEIVARNGDRRLVSISTSVVEADDGGRAYVALVSDLTERRRAEEDRRALEARIQQAHKLESLGLLASGIAHDFNNLLTAMVGYADLALGTVPASSDAHRMLTEIEAAAGSAIEMTRLMLAYAGRGQFALERLALDEVVRDMVRLLQPGFGADIEVALDLGTAVLKGDVAQIRQVVMNLVSNAAEAIPDGGRIWIGTGVRHAAREELRSVHLQEELPEGNYAWLQVRDTGHGMSPETMARMFDPFFSTKVSGRGLGLAAVLGIVRRHGGTIKVASELESGTQIEVLFPFHGGPVEVRSPPQVGTPRPADARAILVVEDNPTVRAFIARVLDRAGLPAVMATDGREGVDLFEQRQHEISLAIVNFAIPKLSGVEVLATLRAADEKLPVLMISGYNEGDVRRATAPAPHGFLQKPFKADDLIAAIATVFDASEA